MEKLNILKNENEASIYLVKTNLKKKVVSSKQCVESKNSWKSVIPDFKRCHLTSVEIVSTVFKTALILRVGRKEKKKKEFIN